MIFLQFATSKQKQQTFSGNFENYSWFARLQIFVK